MREEREGEDKARAGLSMHIFMCACGCWHCCIGTMSESVLRRGVSESLAVLVDLFVSLSSQSEHVHIKASACVRGCMRVCVHVCACMHVYVRGRNHAILPMLPASRTLTTTQPLTESTRARADSLGAQSPSDSSPLIASSRPDGPDAARSARFARAGRICRLPAARWRAAREVSP